MTKNLDETHSHSHAECEHAVRIRIAHSHILTSTLPRFVSLAAIPIAETGQLYPDDDSAHDARRALKHSA